MALFIWLTSQGCSSFLGSNNSKPEMNPEVQLINQYSSEYFVGLGKGVSPSQQTALKIARASALGELSTNVKVFITSKLEIQSSEQKGRYNETVTQHITEIGNAVVRSPEYEMIKSSMDKNTAQYEVHVLAKKLKRDQIKEAARSIEIDDISRIIDLLTK
ncbi:MAG: hypothetical protein HOI55_15265 [Candidatus Marinimicrobia bacterium]|nr:hypothetical protein [Candidatus Neomarinimicrobiota bacterium]MBT5761008.1 hypothetical protein [Candidatus Neomarinimicrobiota bacterium]MBT6391259.1 hypothetical protein [Candidatus Neomarinimicrobiota bacterium]